MNIADRIATAIGVRKAGDCSKGVILRTIDDRTLLAWMPGPPEVRAEIESVEESLAVLPGLEETLDRFQDMGLEGRLREQSLRVRLVEEILEGGREAFETRRRKYGF